MYHGDFITFFEHLLNSIFWFQVEGFGNPKAGEEYPPHLWPEKEKELQPEIRLREKIEQDIKGGKYGELHLYTDEIDVQTWENIRKPWLSNNEEYIPNTVLIPQAAYS